MDKEEWAALWDFLHAPDVQAELSPDERSVIIKMFEIMWDHLADPLERIHPTEGSR